MSEIINLFKPQADSTFTIDNVDKNRLLTTVVPMADFYLQELKLNTPFRCCAFRDIGGIGSIPDGPIFSQRQGMLTLPQGIGYVNYTLDTANPNPIVIGNGAEEIKLPQLLHTLLLFDIVFSPIPPEPFHYCNDTPQPDIPPFACVDTVTSLRQSPERPFHLFYTDDLIIRTQYYENATFKGHLYYVPFAMSEGVIVYFVINDDANQTNILNALANEILKVQSITDGAHHWTIRSEIIYQDNYGIFTCTCMESINKVKIGTC